VETAVVDEAGWTTLARDSRLALSRSVVFLVENVTQRPGDTYHVTVTSQDGARSSFWRCANSSQSCPWVGLMLGLGLVGSTTAKVLKI